MSFTFGQFSFTDSLPTSFAIQREFPNMSGLGIESLEVPGMERRRFLQTDRPATTIVFDVILHADTAEELETRRDQLMTLLDPALGPQALVLDEHPDWYWTAAVSDEIVWEKLTWGCEYRGYRYRADIVFETYGDAASRHVGEGGLPVVGELVIPPQGNTRAWPTIELRGTLTAGQSVTLAIDSHRDIFTVEVLGPLASGQVMRLDYDTMQFAVWQGTTKVASLVNRMSHLERPETHPTSSTTVSVGMPGGEAAQVAFNSVRNPVPGTNGTSLWRLSGGTDTEWSISAPDTPWPEFPQMFRCTATQSTHFMKIIATGDHELEGEQTYEVEIRGRASHSGRFYPNLHCYTPDGTHTREIFLTDQGVDVEPWEWVTVRVPFTLEAGESRVDVGIRLNNSALSGERVTLEGVAWVGPVGEEFFWGDTPSGGAYTYTWESTPYASASYKLQNAPFNGEVTYFPNSRRQ